MAERWTHLYKDYLPALAAARDPVQSRWPIQLDHCFARVILDNAVGIDRPWMEVVKQPAIKHMTVTQFDAAIQLGEKIARGEADLVALDQNSLCMRQKWPKPKRKAENEDTIPATVKQRRPNETISKYCASSPLPKLVEAVPDHNSSHAGRGRLLHKGEDNMDMSVQHQKILDSDLTAFRKIALRLLCQIPKGRYSTYQAMSDYITKSSHKTCARAVGNAMRNNPFAPEVPCHRVLASDGSLGGFCGDWGEGGKFANEKHKLLFEEGVKFNSAGKVQGPVFREYTLLD